MEEGTPTKGGDKQYRQQRLAHETTRLFISVAFADVNPSSPLNLSETRRVEAGNVVHAKQNSLAERTSMNRGAARHRSQRDEQDEWGFAAGYSCGILTEEFTTFLV